MTTVEDAKFALSKILDAGSNKNVIELEWIKNVRVIAPRVIITLSLPSFANSQRERIVQEVRKILTEFEDIKESMEDGGDCTLKPKVLAKKYISMH